mmetsp:Transcript_42497/g.56062  ORF Transcript_42497/g.56062 Transcript_42497/m.56062 type:complete len:90 (-) Transcript_42497:4-273(-)
MLRFDGLALHLEDDVWVHLADPLGVARQLRAVDVQLERAQAVIVVALRLLNYFFYSAHSVVVSVLFRSLSIDLGRNAVCGRAVVLKNKL